MSFSPKLLDWVISNFNFPSPEHIHVNYCIAYWAYVAIKTITSNSSNLPQHHSTLGSDLPLNGDVDGNWE